MLKAPAQFYIPATESLLERRPRILKQGDTFGVFDQYGDILPGEGSQEGLYHNDTRHLSGLRVLVDGKRPLLLSSKVQDNNSGLSIDLTNPDLVENDRLVLARDMVHIMRTAYLWDGACFERLRLQNFDDKPLDVDIEIVFAADFADMFEVRGQRRAARGETRIDHTQSRTKISYLGLDGIERSTIMDFEPAPTTLSQHAAQYRVALPPGGRKSIFFSISCGAEARLKPAPTRDFFINMRRAGRELRRGVARNVHVATSNDVFNEVLSRSIADLSMLVTQTEHGPFPYAGIPWFSTNFGRDALITAMSALWIDPQLAKGVLTFLAATQAHEKSSEDDAEPGKIIHEMRRGEMARLKEVPFERYYGSIDGTPLFVALAGYYFDRTNDLETISALWPNILAALRWVDEYGDRDGDGFVEYQRAGATGLSNQGWKDSADSVFHRNGTLASGPIALCEVQGYVYAAKCEAAKLATAQGFHEEAARLFQKAQELRRRFDDAFWCEDIGFYALALDGGKQPCKVRASNAGQLLFTGIVSRERAKQIGAALFSRAFYSGWGVRTVAETEARYNPMSYHNGSVWPHDNALIGVGLARYGLKRHLQTLFAGLFDSASYVDLRRLPELFCGFQRAHGKGPVFYPVACSPQAWAAATPLALLQACLGLEMDVAGNCVRFRQPVLPPFLQEVTLRGLAVGEGRLDVALRRYGAHVAVNILHAEGGTRVEVIL